MFEGLFEGIKNIFYGLISIITGIYSIFGWLLSIFFIIVIIYLLIVRPIWGSFFDKGNRLYWLSLLLLLAFGIFFGPLLVIELSDQYGTTGLISGLLLYLVVIWLISLPGIKKEKEMDK